ncbi:2-dehydro-3-deoxygluconokinase [Prauserella aidingensis]|uniref:sugar kinase n=1 Tax=Prauserella aidingensis TaxID=387890 RepID=UPI0020A3E0DB|nr:sugar kinase [Prauserella aidingensis]MCP2255567.1 2-dehydro-3-deoxygluconokinase [Prauserella aidingensis]
MSGLVTLGEAMAMLTSPIVGPLRHAPNLTLGVAGAEATVAIGVTRLGSRATWIGRVGDDEFGRLIRMTLAGQQLPAEHVLTDDHAPTALMVKERRTGTRTRVSYYRTSSAGSRLRPADVDETAVRRAGALHLTGITPALSESARDAAFAAAETARDADVPISLDLNYRRALWTPDEATATLRPLTSAATVVFATEDEARLLVDGSDPAQLAGALAELGPREVVIKRGGDGAVALIDGEIVTVAPRPTTVVDPVGAGDSFAAAYLAARLRGDRIRQRLDDAAAAGALTVAVAGDWEGLPDRGELAADTSDVTR